MAKEVKVPKTLGGCADRLFELKAKIAELHKDEEVLKAELAAIKEHLIQNLPKSDAQGVLGKVARATITSKQVPSVKDWDAFYKLILKTKDFSLMQRRVSDTAIRERWEAGKTVAGVEPFTVIDVSINKIA